MESQSSNVTALLQQFGQGDLTSDDRLMSLVYDELKALARRQLKKESAKGRGLLQTTALANEVYLKLVDQNQTDWKNRAHFFAIASRLIRRILVDEARARQAAKRGGDWRRITMHNGLSDQNGSELDLVALEEALKQLTSLDERQAQVVELRFFGGLSVKEVAEVLDVSTRTIEADWTMAKSWLHRAMS
ncbi:MAG: sigma-70 family RNA polymerase sigma factor [Planctomycetota bacterium]|nr:sigma-70 family RNA polymerase sigma factor [Planctomycetota bacterium]